MRWVRTRRVGKPKRVLNVSDLNKKGETGGIPGENYKRVECSDVEEECQLFKSAELGCIEKVYGTRRVGGGVRKGSEWWCEDVRAVAEKEAYP